MSITSANLALVLSNPAASQGNSIAQSDAALSLGKHPSTTVWAGGTLHDLFDVLTGDDNAGLIADYRCLFVENRHPTLTWTSVAAWLAAQTVGGASIAIGVDPTAATVLNAPAVQAVTAATRNTPPVGVVFSAPTTKNTGLSLGNIAPGFCRALWLRRTATNSAALDPDDADLSVEGDTL